MGREAFLAANAIPDKPIVALLAGSRKQEITANLPVMLEAMKDIQIVEPMLTIRSAWKEEYQEQLDALIDSILEGINYEL